MNTINAIQQQVIDALPFIAVLLKPNYEIIFANKMYRKFVCHANTGVTGKNCFSIWQLNEPCSNCPIRQVIENRTPAEVLLSDQALNSGSNIQGKWKLHLYPIEEEGGKILKILEVAYEVTPVDQIRKALITSQERLRQAEALAHIGHWELNLKTNVLYWSDEIFTIFGLNKHHFEASYESFLAAIHPEDREKVNAAYSDSLANQVPYEIEHRIVLPDGQIKYVHERCLHYYDPDGKQARSLGTVQDITERIKIEMENDKLQKQVTQVQRLESLGRLAGGVAHDYNNISSVIMGYAELGLEKLDKLDPIYEYFNTIFDTARKSSNITRQLLAFAKMQATEPKLINLNDTISDFLKILRRLVGEDVEIVFIPDEKIWPVKIDPAQLDQILANLCVNAKDAIEDVGKITIETSNIYFDEAYCRVHVDLTPGDFVSLSVSDDGYGISPKDIAKVFDPFFTTKEMGRGTGLGLATVYGIVKQNKGIINLYSEEGIGTVFNICFPKHSGELINQNDVERKVVPLSCGETILFVEDDNSFRKIGEIFLLELGYVVLSSGSPQNAIKMAQNYTAKIDLLITDVVMPEMNGRVLSERIRRMYPAVKTLYISGYTANIVETKGLLENSISFLSKPFSKVDLAFKIRETLAIPQISD